MRRICALLLLLLLVACDNYQVVDKGNGSTKVVDLKTCNCEIISKAELNTLKEQAELAKNVNRYQMRSEGLRTWRFDTSTGRVCLLLTTDADWKRPDTERQNCAYQPD